MVLHCSARRAWSSSG